MGAEDSNYDACMVGGTRPKHQKLRGTCREILDVMRDRFCDGQHPHEPWKVDGRPQTSQEAAYPQLFCDMAAEALSQHMVQDQGEQQHPDTVAVEVQGKALAPLLAAAKPPNVAAHQQRLKEATGPQPRTSRCSRLIPEYKDVRLVLATPCQTSTACKLREKSKGCNSKQCPLTAACCSLQGCQGHERCKDLDTQPTTRASHQQTHQQHSHQ